MAKFLKLEVTRTSGTDLYVSVPDDFDEKLLMRNKYQPVVADAASESTDEYDWDDYEWEQTVEVQGVTVVEESEARKYTVAKLDLTT